MVNGEWLSCLDNGLEEARLEKRQRDPEKKHVDRYV